MALRESKAAVLVDKQKIEIRKFPLPAIGTQGGILKVDACGVCGFDSEAYLYGGNGVFQLPCVIGHEIVGRIDEISEESAARWGLKAGDRVVVEEYIPCGVCDNCLTGDYQLCFDLRYGAMSVDHPTTALWGGFAEYMYLHPRSIVHKVDQTTPAELLQLFIPISNGIHWVQEVGRTQVGDTVVIQGPGPMGLGAIIGAKEAGAANIIVTGLSRDEHRLNIAKELGAHHVFYADTQDIVKEIKEVTDGKMANTVINAATAPQQLVIALDLAGLKGTIVHSGTDERLADRMMTSKITWKLLTIKGVLGRPKRTVGTALRIIESQKYPLEKMITHTFSLEDAGQAVDTHAFGREQCIHVAVVNE